MHKNLLGKLSVLGVTLAVLMLGRHGAMAQMPGGDSDVLFKVVKIFGNHPAFAAKAEMHVFNKTKKETDTMPMNFALLDGRWRMDIDVAQIKSAEMPPQLLPGLKQMGLDQMVVVMRPDKKIILSSYPRMKAYVETPMSSKEEAAAAKTYKIEKTRLGKESVDGHSCEKYKVVLIDAGKDGEKFEATVWNAADLKDFPVQIQVHDQDSTVLLKFKDVKLGNPGADKFEAPAGMTKYTDATKLMTDATAKMTGGQK